MEIISRDFTDKPSRHIFDRRAFRRYSAGLLISPFFALLMQALPLLIQKRQMDSVIPLLFIGLQGLLFVVPLISFLSMLFTMRGSDVFTAPGCVLYRKKRLYASQLDGISYIVYHITNVKTVSSSEKGPASVSGNINAVYVLKDGITINSYKTCRKVSIPPCFTDMDIIRGTLKDMETDSRNTNAEYFTY